MSKQRFYTSYDNTGRSYKIPMPEDKLNIFQQGGGVIDLLPFIALIGTIVAGFIIF